MLSRLRNQRGFTLIEIMIVVAIMGTLMTLAIPKLMTYRARSFRAEVKSNLGAIRSSQEAYYSESGDYSDDLRRIGFSPTGQPRYIYGFTSDALPAASGVNDTAELAPTTRDYGTEQMLNGAGLPLTQSDLPAAVVSTTTYVISATGNIDFDADMDAWTYDQNTGFSMVSDDL